MSGPHWDPQRYLRFADERGRPYGDLLARIPSGSGLRPVGSIVDLGCGPGNLTTLLAERWPDARVLGVDSSPEMVERARAGQAAGEIAATIGFEVADLRDWLSDPGGEPVDLLISNATLQWVPGHLELLPAMVARVRPGGHLAFQVPGNFAEPSHALLREIAARAPYAAHTAGVAVPSAHDPATYLRRLRAHGCEVDAWETTYLHLLQGPDPVFTWISGTGARPVLQALPDDLRAGFESAYKAALREAYPTEPDGGVVLPFRRVFVVARIPETAPPTGGAP